MAAANYKSALGIDLGTTFSCVSVFHDGIAEVIPDERGNIILPSIVAYITKNARKVGTSADAARKTNPTRLGLQCQTPYLKKLGGGSCCSCYLQK